jgi:hypothetical protein
MRGSGPANLFRAGALPNAASQFETDWFVPAPPKFNKLSSLRSHVRQQLRPHFSEFPDANQRDAEGDQKPQVLTAWWLTNLSPTKGYLRHPLQFAAVLLITRRQHYAPTRQPLDGTSCGTWWSPGSDGLHVWLIRGLPKFARAKLRVTTVYVGYVGINSAGALARAIRTVKSHTGDLHRAKRTTMVWSKQCRHPLSHTDKARRLAEETLIPEPRVLGLARLACMSTSRGS